MSTPPNNNPNSINKPLVGILAIGCLVGALVTWIVSPEQQAMYAALLRIGAVLCALWLALPKPGEEIRWAKFSRYIVAAVVLTVLTRRLILLAIPLLAVVFLLELMFRPRAKQRPRSRSHT